MAETDPRITALTELLIGQIAEANSVRGGAVDRIFASALRSVEAQLEEHTDASHLAEAANFLQNLRGRFG